MNIPTSPLSCPDAHTRRNARTKLASASLLPVALASFFLVATQAQAVTVTVNGSADVYNATGTFEGTAPAFIDVTGLTSMTFAASTGTTVTVNGGGNFNDADGVGSASGEFNTGSSTLSGITAPTAGFIAGVFLSASVSPLAPAALNFSAAGTNFSSLTPLLQQTFFVGDGLTGDGTGARQTFFVPVGATRLYLGLADACGYSGSPSCFSDNSGSFTVVTTGGMPLVAAVPEPETYALMLGGLAMLGTTLRRRRSKTEG